MVLVSLNDLEDDVYPGVQEYAKCQSRAFMKGFIGFVAGGAAGLTGSIYARQKFASKFAPKHTVSVMAGGAIVLGYITASVASRKCQRNWVRTAQAEGYNSYDIVPAQKEADSTTKKPTATSEVGKDETDVPVFKKTKYGDTMG
ncbi:transmembrane protein 141-like [Diadema antillarum]|uniref:transmembrane protein 141-like n=1 Tax=Diadema antillarum TaxID=105358 RepID=UPI003A84BD77